MNALALCRFLPPGGQAKAYFRRIFPSTAYLAFHFTFDRLCVDMFIQGLYLAASRTASDGTLRLRALDGTEEHIAGGDRGRCVACM